MTTGPAALAAHPPRPFLIGLFSPTIAMGVSLGIAFGSVLLSARFYEDLVQEPNWMHLNPEVLLFVLLCAAAFGTGLWLGHLALQAAGRSPPVPTLARQEGSWIVRGVFIVLALGMLSLLVNVYLLFKVFRAISLPKLVVVFSLQENARGVGSDTVGLLQSGNYWIPVFTQVVVHYGAWLYLSGRAVLPRWVHRILGVVLLGCIGVLGVSLALTLKRGPMLEFGMSLVVLWALWAHFSGKLSGRRVVMLVVPFLIAAVAYFSVIQISKNIGNYRNAARDVEGAVLGYYGGPYNRLAKLLTGNLSLGNGDGYIWTRWVWEFSVTNALFGLDHTADRLFPRKPPSGAEGRTWYISAAGLDRRYTAITAFGMSFVDFGWWGWVPFLPYGLLVGFLWGLFLRGRFWGIMLYPTCLWSVLEWRGYLEITREQVLGFVIFSACLWLAMQVRLLPGRPALNGPEPAPLTDFRAR